MLIETEAILLNIDWPDGGVPWKVNGIEMVNWPPKAWDALLRNQTVAIC